MVADLALFPPAASGILLAGFFAIGVIAAHSSNGFPLLAVLAASVLFVLAAGWITAFAIAPNWGAKDGHGGIELIRREDRLHGLWTLACSLSYVVGFGANRVARRRWN